MMRLDMRVWAGTNHLSRNINEMDETESIRAVIARSFAILGASVHARDPEDQMDIAEEFEHFILTGERLAEYFDPEMVGMLDKCMSTWKPRKRKA